MTKKQQLRLLGDSSLTPRKSIRACANPLGARSNAPEGCTRPATDSSMEAPYKGEESSARSRGQDLGSSHSETHWHTALLPLRTQSPNGQHGHWAPLARRRKTERRWAALSTPACPLPAVVTLTRHSAGTLDDDNLRGALKGVRDGVADALGVKDNDPRVEWRYAQAKAPRGHYAVQIDVEAA